MAEEMILYVEPTPGLDDGRPSFAATAEDIGTAATSNRRRVVCFLFCFVCCTTCATKSEKRENDFAVVVSRVHLALRAADRVANTDSF